MVRGMFHKAVAAIAMILPGVRAFIVAPSRYARSSRSVIESNAQAYGRRQSSALSMAAPLEGAHGMRSRFLPIDQLDEQTYSPRIVQVAGALPDVTVDDIMAVGFTPAPELGMWQYDFSDPEGPQMGTVALPGSELVHNMVEPVAIVVHNRELNVQMPGNEEVEVLVVLDRTNQDFELGKFFLWDTPDAGLQVRYFEGAPSQGYRCIGRVGLVMVPYVPSMARTFTGFEEEEY